MVQPFILARYPPEGKAYPHPQWSSRSSSLHYPLPGRPIRTASGPGVHLHSPSAARKAYPDPEWSSRSSLLAIRRQEEVSGPRVVQAFIVTRYPPPGRRIQTATGPGVFRHSLSAARKVHPDRGWSRRSSSLAIRCQEGVSGPRLVQAFIVTPYPPPGRFIRTAGGPGVHLHSLSAARKAYPDRDWSRRLSSLAIRRQEGLSGPRVVQAFIFTRYPLPGRRFRTATGPGVYRHSLSADRRAYPDPEWSRRSSSLAIRRQEGVSGPRVGQAFIFTHYPPPGGRIRTPSGPGVHTHSLSAARKAYGDPEWSRRLSSLTIRRQEGVSGPRVVQAFILTRYPPPGRRIGTPSGPGVYRHSLSAARKVYPDRGWSRRSSSLGVRRQEGVSGPRVVQGFIFTRYPPPRRRILTPSGPAVPLHPLSAARKAYRDPEWSRRSSSLTIRRQEGVSGPRVVQAFILTRYPPPGRRIRTPSGPGVHPHSLSAARKAYPDPEWSTRSSSLAIRRQEGVSGPRVVQPFICTRYPPPGRRFRTTTGPGVHLRSSFRLQEGVYGPEGPTVLFNSPSRRSDDAFGSRMVQSFSSARPSAARDSISDHAGVPAVHLTRLSAVREAYPDRERASRSSLLACCPQGDASGSRGRTPSSEDPTGRSTSPHSFMGCRSRSASLPAGRDGRSSRTAASQPTGCRRTQCPPFPSVARRSPLFRSPSGCHSRMVVGTSSYRVRTIAGSSPAPPPLAIEPRSKTSSDSSRTSHTRQLTGSSVTRRVPSVRPPTPTRL